MNELIADQTLAAEIGAAGRKTALERFNINRFIQDWQQAFNQVCSRSLTLNTKLYEKEDSIHQ
jgi:hypothetical protein